MTIGIALSTVACGESATSEGAPSPEQLAYEELVAENTTTTTLLIEGEPETPLADEQDLLVHFEADWVCELQRRTFDSPAAMSQTLEEKLAANGLSLADYQTFRGEVSNSQELRDWILFVYQESCRA
ncbi:MAG: hypothetical protein ACRBI6_15150 [Acidimicrobiales bacterium]